MPHLAPPSRLLIATEGQRGVKDVIRIHKEARPSTTNLARVAEDRYSRSGKSSGKIGIGKDDIGRLPTEFERHAFEIARVLAWRGSSVPALAARAELRCLQDLSLMPQRRIGSL